MKNLKILTIAVLTPLVIGFTSCDKDDDTMAAGKGTFNISMTDAPADYSSLDVNIESVTAFNSNTNEWVELNGKAQAVQVLELTNGEKTTIANNSNVEAGLYTKLKIKFTDQNQVGVTSNSTSTSNSTATESKFNLTFDNANDKEVIIDITQEVSANQEARILVDFNAAKSVKESNNGNDKVYTFKPEITVLANSETEIAGHIEGGENVVVYIENGTDVRSTYPDENGDYKFIGVFEGDYTLKIAGSNANEEEEIMYEENNINVSAETTATINIIL